MQLLNIISAGLASLMVTLSLANAQEKLQAFNEFDASSTISVDHAAWDDFLGQYIVETDDNRTLVNYGAVSDTDHSSLKSYLSTLQAVDTTTLNKDEAFVYWVNIYNALTVDIILDNYPLRSIRNIFSGLRPGPWQRNIATINGVTITLDNIEHGILRAFWSDNRVHYAVNCASIGCPNLMGRAFSVDGLDETLDQLARDYVNHPRGFKVENGRVTASSIYNWFKDDFGGGSDGVIAHMKKYANPETAAKLETVIKIGKYDYDWGLNDAK